MTRDEVLDAIYDEVTKHDTCIEDSVVSLLEEIVRLREQLAEEIDRGDKWLWKLTTAERERDEARRERDLYKEQRDEMDRVWREDTEHAVALRHRAERAERVVEAAKVYEQLHVKLIAEGASERYPSRVFDDLCVELDVAANNLCAAVRALDAKAQP